MFIYKKKENINQKFVPPHTQSTHIHTNTHTDTKYDDSIFNIIIFVYLLILTSHS